MNRPLAGDQLVDRAAALAEQWHEGQRHSFGNESYFRMHLAPVAGIVRRLGYGALYVATAYLHDIKEDTDVTDEQLSEAGMPLQVVQAANLLAKKEGQPHAAYLAEILRSPQATVGKFADSLYNLAWTALNSPAPKVSDGDFREWSLEYADNLGVLRPHLPPPGQ